MASTLELLLLFCVCATNVTTEASDRRRRVTWECEGQRAAGETTRERDGNFIVVVLSSAGHSDPAVFADQDNEDSHRSHSNTARRSTAVTRRPDPTWAAAASDPPPSEPARPPAAPAPPPRGAPGLVNDPEMLHELAHLRG